MRVSSDPQSEYYWRTVLGDAANQYDATNGPPIRVNGVVRSDILCADDEEQWVDVQSPASLIGSTPLGVNVPSIHREWGIVEIGETS